MSDQSTGELLRELVQLTRVATYPVAKEMLHDAFFNGDEPQEKRVRVYANLDGRSQREVADAAGASRTSVSKWSGEWKRLGLVGEDGEAVFDIYDFFPELADELEDEEEGNG